MNRIAYCSLKYKKRPSLTQQPIPHCMKSNPNAYNGCRDWERCFGKATSSKNA